ncbi:excinuclease ABC subunit UvrC [uncultured Helicobacter sp.]|uniref:excinuclease ABC subunit UvrC n=2 Tax=uncultured Helicobacter sp. TaxID=175537 RepID=UPI00374F2C46
MTNPTTRVPNQLPNLAHLPQNAGVYQYFDRYGHLLYVGKAKNLKKRIKSYFTPSANLSPRIASMVAQVSEIKTFITPSEQDALILENSLIKSLKPKYNILLRDDKTYPYIYVDYNQDFPTFEITRTLLKKRNITYFGPFSTGARDLLESILQSLPLVQKKSCLRGKKACLFYQIRRCLAPCEGKVSKEEYTQLLAQAIEFLHNKKKLLAKLESKMHALAEHCAFEEAAKIRDSIAKITQMQVSSSIDLLDDSNLDVFVFCADRQHNGVMMKLFVRNGRISSSDVLRIHDESLESHTLQSHPKSQSYSQIVHSLYTQALLNHYKSPSPLLPDSILLPYEIGTFEDKARLEEILKERVGKKITILQPQRGKKYELITIARHNAKEFMRLEEQQNYDYKRDLEVLSELCALSSLPYRIEVFDTSHHSGSACVGGMIVYDNNEFLKSSYRHYHLQGSDEYAQMREMLTRRALDFESNPPPNLWLLDGGAGQIAIALEILESVGVQIDVLGIAKHKLNGRSHRAKGSANDVIYMLDSAMLDSVPMYPKPTHDNTLTSHTHSFSDMHAQVRELRLLPSDRRLQFLQKLRDEAHRYAISFHRSQKLKKLTQIQLLGTQKNLSVAQIDKLLRIYGDFAHIRDLTPEQITQALRQNTKGNKNV